MRKKTALLLLILIITVFPAIGFIGFSLIILGVVLDSSGNVQILVHDNMLEIWGRGGVSTVFSVYLGLFISCTIFFVALFLLIRGLLVERRKKHTVRESYTI